MIGRAVVVIINCYRFQYLDFRLLRPKTCIFFFALLYLSLLLGSLRFLFLFWTTFLLFFVLDDVSLFLVTVFPLQAFSLPRLFTGLVSHLLKRPSSPVRKYRLELSLFAISTNRSLFAASLPTYSLQMCTPLTAIFLTVVGDTALDTAFPVVSTMMISHPLTAFPQAPGRKSISLLAETKLEDLVQ